jgi:hypothetical protein
VKKETVLTSAVIDAVNASTLATVWRNHAGSVRVRRGYLHLGPEGTPDIIGFTRDGRFIGIETKVAGNRTGKERLRLQEEWRARIVAAGGVAGFARSVDEALALLRARGH